MDGVPDGIFSTVYSSHCLEHLDDDVTAIRNWWRILKSGGHLIIVVPHKDMYEKKECLPSNWNGEHKRYYVPDPSYPIGNSSCTYSLLSRILSALPVDCGINDPIKVMINTLNENFISNGPDQHSSGEYSIEAIIRKL